jgi:hypothetical protein
MPFWRYAFVCNGNRRTFRDPKTSVCKSVISSRKRITVSVAWLAIARSPAARRRLRFPSPKSQCQRAPLERAPFRGSSSKARPRRAEARRVRAETVPGPGGRRGFYARPVCVSTTFSRKQRISQWSEKHQENQRDFCAPETLRCLRERSGAATDLTYRFASQASSQMRDADSSPKWRPKL